LAPGGLSRCRGQGVVEARPVGVGEDDEDVHVETPPWRSSYTGTPSASHNSSPASSAPGRRYGLRSSWVAASGSSATDSLRHARSSGRQWPGAGTPAPVAGADSPYSLLAGTAVPATSSRLGEPQT
jgi:hypothetical protein